MTDPDRIRELVRELLKLAALRINTTACSSECFAEMALRNACTAGNIYALCTASLALLDRLSAAEDERDDLVHDIGRHLLIATRETEARIAAEQARDEAYAKSAALLEMSNESLKLMAGEMTAGELRTTQAVLKSRAAKIRALRTKE